MPVRVLFSAHRKRAGDWLPALRSGLAGAGIDAELTTSSEDPATVDYVVYSPDGPLRDFSGFANLKAVLSIWAGVDTIAGNPTIAAPLTRMVDPSIVDAMREWVTGQVLRHHLGFDHHIRTQDGVWRDDLCPPLARSRSITLLGLGELGTACAETLAALKFNVTGWSRTPKDIPGIRCVAGEEGLSQALASAEILILLLPLTRETENLLDRRRLESIRPGATLINSGRGALIEDGALIDALDSGRIAHATLDVFRQEPLPPEHPFWAHSRVTVWPHISSETDVATAAPAIIENIRRSLAGEPLLHLVDRKRGY